MDGAWVWWKWRTIPNLSMLADHPNLPETSTQGEELRRFETWTLATFSPSCCLIQSHNRLYSCLVSLSLTSSSSPGIGTQSHYQRCNLRAPKRWELCQEKALTLSLWITQQKLKVLTKFKIFLADINEFLLFICLQVLDGNFINRLN